MKSLYKPFRGTMRKELRQKMVALAILNHPTFGENSQNDDTKFYESGHFRGDLSSICFQSVSRRFARNYMSPGKRNFILRTTQAALRAEKSQAKHLQMLFVKILFLDQTITFRGTSPFQVQNG
jgi:hypothetical protein